MVAESNQLRLIARDEACSVVGLDTCKIETFTLDELTSTEFFKPGSFFIVLLVQAGFQHRQTPVISHTAFHRRCRAKDLRA